MKLAHINQCQTKLGKSTFYCISTNFFDCAHFLWTHCVHPFDTSHPLRFDRLLVLHTLNHCFNMTEVPTKTSAIPPVHDWLIFCVFISLIRPNRLLVRMFFALVECHSYALSCNGLVRRRQWWSEAKIKIETIRQYSCCVRISSRLGYR